MGLKFCRNCKHMKIEERVMMCYHPNNRVVTDVDLLTGEETILSGKEYCVQQRKHNWLISRYYHLCGRDARWYEEIEK